LIDGSIKLWSMLPPIRISLGVWQHLRIAREPHFPVSFPNLAGCARSGMLYVPYAFALGEPGLK
jgi:hypothetical protein